MGTDVNGICFFLGPPVLQFDMLVEQCAERCHEEPRLLWLHQSRGVDCGLRAVRFGDFTQCLGSQSASAASRLPDRRVRYICSSIRRQSISKTKIFFPEDIEECTVVPVAQTQWTPLPEAVCAVVLRLSSQGRPAGIETIREALILAFPHVSPPSEHALYDTLVQLTKERKLYNTSSGYFIVTPEKRRSRSQSRSRKRDENGIEPTNKSMLMSAEEAMVMVHGDMATIRDGNITHQCIQTNLADVICGGRIKSQIKMFLHFCIPIRSRKCER